LIACQIPLLPGKNNSLQKEKMKIEGQFFIFAG